MSFSFYMMDDLRCFFSFFCGGGGGGWFSSRWLFGTQLGWWSRSVGVPQAGESGECALIQQS